MFDANVCVCVCVCAYVYRVGGVACTAREYVCIERKKKKKNRQQEEVAFGGTKSTATS